MAMSIEDYKLRYEDLSNEELLDDLVYKASERQLAMRDLTYMDDRIELTKQIKAIKAVIMERMGGN